MRRAPAFWARPPGLLSGLLWPAGAGWGAAGRLRRALARPHHAPVPVICVGNLVAGGAGKTPVALALAACLADGGGAVHIVTRGYCSRLSGPVRVDPARHDFTAVGDEALLLEAGADLVVTSLDRIDMAALVSGILSLLPVTEDGPDA